MALALALGCVAAAACAYVLAGIVLAARDRGVAPRRELRLRGRALAACEALGHTRAFSRLAGMDAVRPASQSLRRAFARLGFELTVQGSLAAAAAASSAACLACLAVSGSALGLAVGAAASAALVGVVHGRDGRALSDARAAQMPEVLRSLAGALGAGKSLPQAIEHVGTSLGEPMGTEFLRASFEIQGGSPVEEAVEALCARVDAPGVTLLCTALQISQRTGSPLTELFGRTARMVSDTVALRRELQVKTSQVRLSARVVAALPVALCGMLVLFSADYRAGLALPEGKACLAAAALLDMLALWLIRRAMVGSGG